MPRPGDVALLARMMFTEAAEDTDAYAGVGFAAVDRIGARDYRNLRSLPDVLTAPKRFQGMEHGDQFYAKAEKPGSLTGSDATAFRKAQSIAASILDGTIPDPTHGATSFHCGPNAGSLGPQIKSGKLVPSVQLGKFRFSRWQAKLMNDTSSIPVSLPVLAA